MNGHLQICSQSEISQNDSHINYSNRLMDFVCEQTCISVTNTLFSTLVYTFCQMWQWQCVWTGRGNLKPATKPDLWCPFYQTHLCSRFHYLPASRPLPAHLDLCKHYQSIHRRLQLHILRWLQYPKGASQSLRPYCCLKVHCHSSSDVKVSLKTGYKNSCQLIPSGVSFSNPIMIFQYLNAKFPCFRFFDNTCCKSCCWARLSRCINSSG